jgi:hypothetical protein
MWLLDLLIGYCVVRACWACLDLYFFERDWKRAKAASALRSQVQRRQQTT